jgi:YVTN family beta-propeller protein
MAGNTHGRILRGLGLGSAALIAFIVAACGGTPLPPGISTGGNPPPPPPPDSSSIRVTPRIFGEDGTGSTSSAKAGRTSKSSRGLKEVQSRARSRVSSKLGVQDANRGSQTSRANSEGGGGSGSNGNDLVDLSGNNLFTGGLTNTTIGATIVFKAQGSGNTLGTITINPDGTGGGTPVALTGQELAGGQNLLVQVAFTGGNSSSSTAIVPSTFFANGNQYGFNIVRRADASLVIEIFIDNLPPLGVADNRSRFVLDTAVDCNADNMLKTVARYESPDGLVLWDSNLDGVFGTAEDACILFDTNGDNVIDNKDTPCAFALDPNLDGSTGSDEVRLLGNNRPEDFINDVLLSATPTSSIGNGLSTITLTTRIAAAFDGSPIGSTLNYAVELLSGTLASGVQGGADAVFTVNGQKTLARSLSPDNPAVSVRSVGEIDVTDSIRMPVLDSTGVLRISLSYATSTSSAPKQITLDVNLARNTSPTLTRVDFIGTVALNPSLSGLEALSEAAKVVEGAPIQIKGTNFASNPGQILLTIGGVAAPVLAVSGNGTVLDAFIPEGASANHAPISVVQGGAGASTSQAFVVTSAPLQVVQVLPANNAVNVSLSGTISIVFNQPVSPSSVENGLRVYTPGGTPVPGSASVSSDGLTVTFIPASFPPSTVVEATIDGDLTAGTGVHFDANISNATLPSAEPVLVVAHFTTASSAAGDTTPPTVSSATITPPVGANDPWALRITFSEPVAPSSLLSGAVPLPTDSLVFSQGDGSNLATAPKISMDFSFADNTGTVVIAKLVDAPLGRSNYTLTIGTDLTDTFNNHLASAFNQSFPIAMRVDRLSAISGPVNTEIFIEGSTFSANASEIAVTFAGAGGSRIPASIKDPGTLDVSVKVPTGAIAGTVEITVDGQTAVSPKPFTVTSAGFNRRVIGNGAGAFGLAVDFDDRALVSFQGAGELGLFDLALEGPIDINPSTPAIDRLATGGVPTEAKLDLTGTLGFTTNYGPVSQPGQSVFVIDMKTLQPRAAIQVGRRPTRLAVSPNNRRVYVTNFLDDNVSVIDIESLTVEQVIPVGTGPNGIAIAPDNSRGFVCNFLDGTVTVFEIGSLTPVGTIVVGLNPARVTLSPDSKTIFVTNFGDGTISVVDVETLAILQTISGFSAPSSITLTSDGTKMYVANRDNNTIQQVVKNEGSGLWELSSVLIATGDTPATVVLSPDGSVLVYTAEGAGEVGIISIGDPQPVVEGFQIDVNGIPGRATFSVDRRQPLWIKGRGFDLNKQNLEITMGGQPVLPANILQATRKAIKIYVDGDAQSGSIQVIRRLSGGETRTSNGDAAVLVTGKNPVVVSATPGDGSAGIPGDTRIVVDFSEPIDESSVFDDGGNVRKVNDVAIMRVVRLSDTGGTPVPMNGLWRANALGFRYEFRLGSGVTLLEPGSNNQYEIVVSPNVKDLFGNGVTGAATGFGSANDTNLGSSATSGLSAASLGFRSRFQTSDLLGPRIVEAVFRDIDNNGVSAGDQLELRYDEVLFYEPGATGTFNAAPGIQMSSGSLGASASAIPGQSPRHLLLTLGAGATFSFGAGGTTVNTLGTVINQIRDYAGNRPSVGQAVPIVLDPASDNQDYPNLLAAYIQNSELRLVFNEPVFLGSALNTNPGNPSTVISLSGAASLGTSAFVARVPGEDSRVVRIALTVAAQSSITTSGASQTMLTLANGAALGLNGQQIMNPGAFDDFLGNPAYAGAAVARGIGAGVPGAATLPYDSVNKTSPSPPRYYDASGSASGLSEGDYIVVTFSNPVVFNPLAGGTNLKPSDFFKLGVAGDRFGQGAKLMQPAFIKVVGAGGSTQTITIKPEEIVVRLGQNPVMTLRGEFGKQQTAADFALLP